MQMKNVRLEEKGTLKQKIKDARVDRKSST